MREEDQKPAEADGEWRHEAGTGKRQTGPARFAVPDKQSGQQLKEGGTGQFANQPAFKRERFQNKMA